MALQGQEIMLIVVAIVLLFGAASIPKLARALGRAKGEFQKGKQEFDRSVALGEKDAEGPSEAQIRSAAREMGIDEANMSFDEVKDALNNKVG